MSNRKPNDPREYCRNCDHAEFKHDRDRAFPYCGFISQFLDIPDDNFCPCFEFVSEDNLEYLEYKLKKKENEQLLG